MEADDEINVGVWVDDRLAALAPAEGWRPDLAVGLQRLSRRRVASGGQPGRWAWVLAVAAVLCVCASLFPATRVFARRCVSACVVETNLVAGRLLSRGRSDPAQTFAGITNIGERRLAPDFALPDMSGKAIQLSNFRGQVVLLNFWATWCGPCQVEIPWFVEIERAYRDAGVTILGVSMDEGGWNTVKPYVEEKRVNYRVLLGDDGTSRKFGGIESLPETLLIDRAGRIAVRHVGLVAKNTYDQELRALLEEK